MNTLFVTRSFDFIWNVKSKLELFVSFFFFFFFRASAMVKAKFGWKRDGNGV